MTYEYIFKKVEKKKSKLIRGPLGIELNLTENSDYDIVEHKLVNVKQPENFGDVIKRQRLQGGLILCMLI